jgi:rubredoxin
MSQPDLASTSANGDHDEGKAGDLPLGLVCPSCGSKLIRRSMRRSFKDRLMSLLGRWPYRCQMCDMRFNGPQDPASIAREAAHQERLHEEEFVDDESEDSSDESKK